MQDRQAAGPQLAAYNRDATRRSCRKLFGGPRFASMAQLRLSLLASAREPIHGRFLQQWRRYEPYLGPLRKRLGALGC